MGSSQDDDLIGTDKPEHVARLFVQHVLLDRPVAKKRDARFQRRTLFLDPHKLEFEPGALFFHFLHGDDAVAARPRMKQEICNQ